MTRTSEQYLDSLRDGRFISIDGERVKDVTEHPAFRRSARAIAHLYDIARENEDVMTFKSPKTGDQVNSSYLIPKSYEDLIARREAMRKWADGHYGFMGRAPDHVASLLTGLAAAPGVLAEADPKFADNAVRMYEKARDEDLYFSYVIINPQVDRSRSSSEQEEQFIHAGIAEEKDDGFIVRGAKMIGTGAVFSDYIFVSTIQPMKPEDVDYAFSFAIPIDTPGLKLYSRRSYEASASSIYDYPLSSRYDENDCLVVFDNVKVPWENTFVYRNVELTAAQFFKTPAHVYINTQAQIRCWTKLEFIAGLALKVVETNGLSREPMVVDTLGRLGTIVAMIEAGVRATEQAFEKLDNGVVRPNARLMYATMAQAGPTYTEAIEILRNLSGGGVIQVPSSVRDFFDKDAGEDFRKYVKSPGVNAEERVRLFKLVWDVIGSEFGGRHQQYEIFYSGGPRVAKMYSFRNFNWGICSEMVNRMLDETPLELPENQG
jgi:4-hydroxyphenylacetate 3-monooxygenase